MGKLKKIKKTFESKKLKNWQFDEIINMILCNILGNYIEKENTRLLEELVFKKEFRIEGRTFE